MIATNNKLYKGCYLLFFLLQLFNRLPAQVLHTDIKKEKEPIAIMELGMAPSWDVKSPNSLLGPTIGIECTPIPDKLEIEFGATQYYNGPKYNWQFDFLLKKPYDISKTIELMVGAGPQWSITGDQHSVSAELAVDIMYWPFKKTIGFYWEPNYDYGFEKQLLAAAMLNLPEGHWVLLHTLCHTQNDTLAHLV